jgi:hypothetical protein
MTESASVLSQVIVSEATELDCPIAATQTFVIRAFVIDSDFWFRVWSFAVLRDAPVGSGVINLYILNSAAINKSLTSLGENLTYRSAITPSAPIF